MSIKFSFSGLDKIQKKFDDAIEKIREHPDSDRYQLAYLFDESFLTEHTKFSNYEELLNAAGYEMTDEIEEDEESLEEFKNKLAEAAGFSSFTELATAAYAKKLREELGS
jgi:hypothetical protein